jgi:hypothetical protein
MTQPQSSADMLAAWKQMSDGFIATWGKTFEAAVKSPQGEAAGQQLQKEYLGMRAAMNEAARSAYGPLIEAAGAVPLSEFQRLQDQVHTILLRMDRIDDALRELTRAHATAAPVPAQPKKKKKS